MVHWSIGNLLSAIIKGTKKMNTIIKSDDERDEFSTRALLEQHIYTPVDNVFPLVCPVMEYKWIPGWKCELLHCPNGHVELGTVFNEISSSPVLADSIAQRTTWTAVLYDPENHRVHFRLDNQISSSLYKLEFETSTSGGTNMRLDMTYCPLGEPEVGEAKIHRHDKIKLMLSILSAMLVHYCERGEMMKTSRIKEMPLPVESLTFVDKFRLVFNKLMKKHMKDDDRIKFFKGVAISRVMPS